MDNHVHGVGASARAHPACEHDIPFSGRRQIEEGRCAWTIGVRVVQHPSSGPCANPRVLGFQLKVVAPALAKGERVVAQHNVSNVFRVEALVNAARGHVVIARTWFCARPSIVAT